MFWTPPSIPWLILCLCFTWLGTASWSFLVTSSECQRKSLLLCSVHPNHWKEETWATTYFIPYLCIKIAWGKWRSNAKTADCRTCWWSSCMEKPCGRLLRSRWMMMMMMIVKYRPKWKHKITVKIWLQMFQISEFHCVFWLIKEEITCLTYTKRFKIIQARLIQNGHFKISFNLQILNVFAMGGWLPPLPIDLMAYPDPGKGIWSFFFPQSDFK